MIVKVFVDTNVLVYAHDADAANKRERADRLLRQLWADRNGVLSTQVLQEFYHNVTRKIPRPMAPAAARAIVQTYSRWARTPLTPATILRGSEIGEASRLSFWDGLILASAEQAGAGVLLSEDLNHGQTIAGVRVVNPFQDRAWPDER